MSAASQFISEMIVPDPTSLDPRAMARGVPALPQQFTWRKRRYRVKAVVITWKDYGDCRHGSGERYLRKHWFHIRTDDGTEMKLYFLRQPGAGRSARARWWIHSIEGKE